ncbi:MAG: MerR family transcriptional regulator [Gaiellaceae bacterium]
MVVLQADSMSSPMSIGEVARLSGRPASSIRYYEEIGLLPAARRVGGRRVYDTAVLRTLSVIDTAQRAGFTLTDAKALLDGRPLRTLAEEKLPAVEALIADAERRRAWLEHASHCECAELDACPLFA